MKELFKKVFAKKTATPIFVGFGAFSIFTFIVFPGLTVANSIINIIATLVGIFTLTFIFYYIDGDKFFITTTEVEPGETELDYLPKEEIIKKKRKVEKPATPYHKKPGTKSTPKVMGEWQVNNKNKKIVK